MIEGNGVSVNEDTKEINVYKYMSVNGFYKEIKNMRRSIDDFRNYQNPCEMVTREIMNMVEGYYLSETSPAFLHGGGISSDTKKYFSIKSLGQHVLNDSGEIRRPDLELLDGRLIEMHNNMDEIFKVLCEEYNTYNDFHQCLGLTEISAQTYAYPNEFIPYDVLTNIEELKIQFPELFV